MTSDFVTTSAVRPEQHPVIFKHDSLSLGSETFGDLRGELMKLICVCALLAGE